MGTDESFIDSKDIYEIQKKELKKYKDSLMVYRVITNNAKYLDKLNLSLKDNKFMDGLIRFNEQLNINRGKLMILMDYLKYGINVDGFSVSLAEEEKGLEHVDEIVQNYLNNISKFRPLTWYETTTEDYMYMLCSEKNGVRKHYFVVDDNIPERFGNISIKHNVLEVPEVLYLLTKYSRDTIHISESKRLKKLLNMNNR